LGSDLSHVGGLDHDIRRDLPLDREVPGLDIRRSQREVREHPPTGSGYKGQSKPGAAVIFTQPNFPVGAVGGGASPRDPKGFSMRPLKTAVFPAKGAFSWARESALTDS